MKRLLNLDLLPLAISLILFGPLCGYGSAQFAHELVELRERLASTTGQEYIAARDEALELPPGSFQDLIALLNLSPKYSMEHVVALILEARANHPEEAARFDRDRRDSLENPDIRRHGGPIYRPWTTREPKKLHPLVYEALIKFDLPGPIDGMVRMPNPDNIPFILYFAKHESPNALAWLITATEGYPEEREWLRPFAVKMYKEHREAGNVRGATGVLGMFRHFGTPQDLAILKELREFEGQLMPAQNIVIRDRHEIGSEWVNANREHKERETELARAEREGAPAQIIVQRQQALEEAETVAIEVNRQYYGNMLWRRVNEHIESLEAQLQREELTEDPSQER